MGRLITAAPALIYGAAALTIVAALAIGAVIRSLRDASQLVDDICNQPREENPQP
ncbi:hypothetical protein SAMN06272781_6840 [Streptomyces sp. 1222.2]|uniref:hypothetical protein n=1 Tax=Streptomyces sp. 1222.2 TaxID=1938833 RepID=UPI000BC7776B|nr:hypothetical protein [Streptomyces sp. 1222.2]SOD80045.1 hypothetical protein SAMN06272781_6840 [Streptomyces sp. 1222.2]